VSPASTLILDPNSAVTFVPPNEEYVLKIIYKNTLTLFEAIPGTPVSTGVAT
jgi:hypothetical protein